MGAASLERKNGIATAEAVRSLMPVFNLSETLRRIENLVVNLARDGQVRANVLSVLPAHDGKTAPAYISDCRRQVVKALTDAGYGVNYHSGGHRSDAELIVSWGDE